MRHASIETTTTYYVGQNAKSTAAELWRVSGNNPGNIAQSVAFTNDTGAKENPGKTRVS